MAIQQWTLSAPRKRQIAWVAGAMTVAVVVYLLSWHRTDDGASYANRRVYICSETGKAFHHDLVIGETTPILSPHSERHTGYPAEPCYWTSDGAIKSSPTYVLLNEYTNKPAPTFCPDCGRLVVPLNPAPMADGRAPPTVDQYQVSFMEDKESRSASEAQE